jgi:hypothetical protein
MPSYFRLMSGWRANLPSGSYPRDPFAAPTTAEAMILGSLGTCGLYFTAKKTKLDVMANVVKAMGDLAEPQRREIAYVAGYVPTIIKRAIANLSFPSQQAPPVLLTTNQTLRTLPSS